MKNFSDLGLAEPILRAVAAEGYTTPTPIQAEVIPAMTAGNDILGIAQTGTGKTAAFVLPLLHRISAQNTRPRPASCNALILAPTRELAAQIADSIRAYGRFMRVSRTVVVGGARPGPQVSAMRPGVDILVATPGRLLDHMATGAIRLDATTAVVLDEADQMLDLGFMPAIRKIMAKVPAARQTVLLSATMPPQIRRLAHDFLDSPAEISVAPQSRPIDRIDQKVVHVDGPAKRGVLVDLLSDRAVERSIVFTRTKRGADKVSQHLQKAGLCADAIHGNKSQNQRQRTLNQFRAGKVTILVATDIAARGIDIDEVSHVFNYELPNVPEAYVHRIGRTARAGRSGVAVSLCEPAERKLLRDIERLIGAALPHDGPTPAGAPRDASRDASRDAQGEARAPARKDQPRPPHARKPRRKPASGAPQNGKPAHGKPANDKPSGGKPHRRSGAKPGADSATAGLARTLGKGNGKHKRPAGFARAASR